MEGVLATAGRSSSWHQPGRRKRNEFEPRAAIHRGCRGNRKRLRAVFCGLSIHNCVPLEVNANSCCSLRLSCFSQSHLPYNWNSYFNSIILMLLLAAEYLVMSAALELIRPSIFGNGSCLGQN